MKNDIINDLTTGDYKYGFTTDIETDVIPTGINEDVIRLISAKKNEPEWLLDFRLKAFRHWQTMQMPTWAHLDIPEIDYQAISYYAAPRKNSPKSLDEVDPELLKTFDKLGIPLEEQKALSGMAVDAVMDSIHLLLVQRGGEGPSRPRAKIPGFGRALHRQLFRGAELCRFLRRLVRLYPKRRALPDGTEHLFPHQREQHRPV